MSVDVFSNNGKDSLNGAITSSGSTSITVHDASSFPSVGNFRIRIDNEYIEVSSVSGNTFTCTRGIEGTTATTHLDATTVYEIITKLSLTNLLFGESVQGCSFSFVGSPGREGRLCYLNDSPFTLRDNGTSWEAFHPKFRGVCKPNVSAFSTWVNQGSASIDTSKGYHLLQVTGGNSSVENIIARVQSVGGLTTWTMQLAFFESGPPSAGYLFGIVLRESSSGKMMAFFFNAASGYTLCATEFSDPNNVHSVLFADSFYGSMGMDRAPVCLQLRADGTNWYFEYSYDFGLTWVEHMRKTISGSYLAGYDQIGFGLDNFNAANVHQTFAMSVIHANFG